MMASPADLIVLDVQMPGVTGSEVLRTIRDKSPDMPVILLTGKDVSPSTLYDVMRFGFSTTVFPTEPFKPEELTQYIQNVVLHRHGEAPSFVASLTAHVLPEIHDSDTGRLDAKRIAEYLSVSLSALAETIGKNIATIHKSPSASSLQESLSPIARILGILVPLLRSRENILAWLNSPHPDMGGRTPMSFILDGKAVAVAELLEAALAGQPS
jgi:response regulator RpfG family c-di-GMP phosphodiesterase